VTAPLTAVAPKPIGLRPAVVAIAAAGSASSGGALVVAIVLDRPLWLTSTFIFVPGFVAFVALTVSLRRDEQELFLIRLKYGALAGVAATIAYDTIRWSIEQLDLTSTNSFQAIRIFGSGLTDGAATSNASFAAGWAFHTVNGVGFALAYVFLAAGRRWYLAVGYALVLEAFMLMLYPGWLGFSMNGEFFSVSVTGHLAYGATLGVLSARIP
jgi:hypothetical protein